MAFSINHYADPDLEPDESGEGDELYEHHRIVADRGQELLEWGAGPRASQYLIVAAKCNALLTGKYSPDIEDVRAVALPILRHRLVRNFKAEAEGLSVEQIIKELL